MAGPVIAAAARFAAKKAADVLKKKAVQKAKSTATKKASTAPKKKKLARSPFPMSKEERAFESAKRASERKLMKRLESRGKPKKK